MEALNFDFNNYEDKTLQLATDKGTMINVDHGTLVPLDYTV